MGTFENDVTPFAVVTLDDRGGDPLPLNLQTTGQDLLKPEVVALILAVSLDIDDAFITILESESKLIGEIKLGNFLLVNALEVELRLIVVRSAELFSMVAYTNRQQEFFNSLLWCIVAIQNFEGFC